MNDNGEKKIKQNNWLLLENLKKMQKMKQCETSENCFLRVFEHKAGGLYIVAEVLMGLH